MRTQPTMGMPDLLPPPPTAVGRAEVAAEPTGPCTAVTRPALRELGDAVAAAHTRAEANVEVNGEAVPTACYPVAATQALDYLTAARDAAAELLAWIDAVGVPPDIIRYPAVSFGVYGSCREIVRLAHVGRHWVAISAIYNAGRGTAAVAVECAHLTTRAIERAESLATDATGCYLAAYGL